MKIYNDSVHFCQKYPTGRILEITTRKIFEPEGMTGFIETLKQIHGNLPKYTGHQGYRYYADEVSKRILDRYPDLAVASKEIIEIANKIHNPSTKALKKAVQPILDKFEKEIDIII